MSKTVHTRLNCPEGKTFIESLATRLFDEMRERNKAAGVAEVELKDYPATIRMTIEIELQ